MKTELNHDERVKEIKNEIKKTGKNTKTRAEWKKYFKEKGYTDDECDLGYVLMGAKINYGPFGPIISIIISIIIGAIIIMIGVRLSDTKDILPIYAALAAGVLPTFFYVCYISFQFKKYSDKVIMTDFHASKEDYPDNWFSKWKKEGIIVLTYKDAEIPELFKLKYDNRETYFGKYKYTFRSGERDTTCTLFIVVQKTKTKFPVVHCLKPGLDRTFWKKEVHLEGNEFNKEYNIYTKNPTDAFYVFNPRIMVALLKKKTLKDLWAFETIGDYIFMVFNDVKLDTSFHFSPKEPIIEYGNYKDVKQSILYKLDLATDLNDVISRQIIDGGESRSVAKK